MGGSLMLLRSIIQKGALLSLLAGFLTLSTPAWASTTSSMLTNSSNPLPTTPPSGIVSLSLSSLNALSANPNLLRAPLISDPNAPFQLTSVRYDANQPEILVTGKEQNRKRHLFWPRVWVQIDDLGTLTFDPQTWIYPVTVSPNGTFSAVLYDPFLADHTEIQVAPPLSTAQTSLNDKFDTLQDMSTKDFLLTYHGQATNQQIGLLTSVWADAVDPGIQALAQSITAFATTPMAKILAVYNWEARHIGYNGALLAQGGYGWSTAEETIATKKGSCVDYANVADALLRSVGIPTEMVLGYASDGKGNVADSGNCGHAWNRSYVNGKWVYFDPTWSRIYLTTPSPNAPPEPTDLYFYQATWFNPPTKLLDHSHSMSAIGYQ